MKISRKTISTTQQVIQSLYTNFDGNNASCKLYVNIEVTGVDTTHLSKTLAGRLHTSLPFINLASPSTSSALTINSIIPVPEVEVTIFSWSAGNLQTLTTVIFN